MNKRKVPQHFSYLPEIETFIKVWPVISLSLVLPSSFFLNLSNAEPLSCNSGLCSPSAHKKLVLQKLKMSNTVSLAAMNPMEARTR